MGAITGVLLFISVQILIFSLAGLVPNSYLLSNFSLANPQDATQNNPAFSLLEIMAGLSIGGVVAGGILGRNLSTILYGAAIGALFGIFIAVIRDYIVLFGVLSQINLTFAILVGSPFLFLGYLIFLETLVRKI